MGELPKLFGYFWHMLLSSSCSDVNKVRLEQNTKKESPKTVTNDVQMYLSVCILTLNFDTTSWKVKKNSLININLR